MSNIIPFDPTVSYLCVGNVATPVSTSDVVQQAALLHARYYNGGSYETQAQMNAWCAVGHPITSAATPKTDQTTTQTQPTILAQSGVSFLDGVVISLAVVIVILLIRRLP